jgi:hypothetical protein
MDRPGGTDLDGQTWMDRPGWTDLEGQTWMDRPGWTDLDGQTKIDGPGWTDRNPEANKNTSWADTFWKIKDMKKVKQVNMDTHGRNWRRATCGAVTK